MSEVGNGLIKTFSSFVRRLSGIFVNVEASNLRREERVVDVEFSNVPVGYSWAKYACEVVLLGYRD